MIEGIVGSLIVAAITGITLLAFKYPAIYDDVFPHINNIAILLICIFFAYNFGLARAQIFVGKVLENPAKNIAIEAIQSQEFPLLLLFSINGLYIVYFLFLNYLSMLAKKHNKNNKPE